MAIGRAYTSTVRLKKGCLVLTLIMWLQQTAAIIPRVQRDDAHGSRGRFVLLNQGVSACSEAP